MTLTDLVGPVTDLLGSVSNPGFSGRAVEQVDVPWGAARKHRQSLLTEAGTPLRLKLPRGTFLAGGTVLADDGTTIIVVRRPPEDAIVLDFAENTGPDAVRRALQLGYLLGNQHAPLDVTAQRLATPLYTSAEQAAATLASLQLVARVEAVPLAAHGWSNTSADHHTGHQHAGNHQDEHTHHGHDRD